MTLTQWNAFVEVCRLGSLRAAADETGFSQPGLSRQLAALERAIGVSLLLRGSRGVSPTAAGRALLPHARMVVNQARRGREAALAATDDRVRLSLGAVPSTTATVAPQAVSLMRRDGGPDCFVVTGLTPRLTAMVLGSELDAALVTDAPPGLPSDPELIAEHLHDDEMVVLAHAGHPLAGPDPVRLEELADEIWIEDNAGSETILRQMAARAGFEPRVTTLADDLLAKSGLVAAGLGVALAPAVVVPALRSDLAVLGLRASAKRGLYVVHRRDRRDLGALVSALRRAAIPVPGQRVG